MTTAKHKPRTTARQGRQRPRYQPLQEILKMPI
eukprot:COSAG02_NODE_32403_length_516_cov_50.971223_1_plen_32_part_10